MPSRSAQSLLFEHVVRRASGANGIPRLAAIEFAQFEDLDTWISLIHPDPDELALKFLRAGQGVCEMMGGNAIGLDYLEFVDPAIKGDAFDSAFVMLSRPCGLWQVSPLSTGDGRDVHVEYTGFPVFDDERERGVLIMLVHHTFERTPRIRQVRSAVEWNWIELRGSGVGR